MTSVICCVLLRLQRRTDREEIRRRLAMGPEDDYYTDRPGRKPSLQARLQSGELSVRCSAVVNVIGRNRNCTNLSKEKL